MQEERLYTHSRMSIFSISSYCTLVPYTIILLQLYNLTCKAVSSKCTKPRTKCKKRGCIHIQGFPYIYYQAVTYTIIVLQLCNRSMQSVISVHKLVRYKLYSQLRIVEGRWRGYYPPPLFDHSGEGEGGGGEKITLKKILNIMHKFEDNYV